MESSDLKIAAGFHRSGNLKQAEQLYREVLAREPANPKALHMLGVLAHDCERWAASAKLIRRSIALDNSVADAHCNLGVALAKLRKYREAIECFQEAIRLRPEWASVHYNLGAALHESGKLLPAEAALREAIRLQPDYAKAHHRLGKVLHKLGSHGAAIAAYRRAIALKGDWAQAQSDLLASLYATAALNEAIECQRRIVALRPAEPQPLSNLLFMLHYHPDATSQELFEEHQTWARKHAERCAADIRPHDNDRDPGRRLRIGYVSSDFRAHPIALFFEPVLERHDREQFEVFCYANVTKPDVMTERLRGHGRVWRDIRRMSDDEVASQIRQDKIDILVDLMGHLDGHRLLIFARKPAPVQVTYLAYPDTIGMKTIDYRITDSWHDPIGTTEKYHTEQLLRLDPCAWCYRPSRPSPKLNRLPALKNGRVTFAALNRLIKTTPAMIQLWSKILRAVPGSRLMVLVGPHGDKEPLIQQLFYRNGIEPDRLVLISRVPRRRYLQQYYSTDLALDVFPYNGHTTTLDALWMGVPVVSLIGDTHVQRAGLSVLTNVGLGEGWCAEAHPTVHPTVQPTSLVARTPEEYVEKAISLASDLPRLTELRRTLREKMRRSPLMDEEGFTRRLEAAYRGMWERWCGREAGGVV
jgi:predicted O-linked N-acetylglucosamine transferase (SPINDLY family)